MFRFKSVINHICGSADYMLQLDLFDDRAQTTSLTTLMLGEVLEKGPKKFKQTIIDLNSLLKQAKDGNYSLVELNL